MAEAQGSSPRRALVTGASRGIGKAIALALADAGYDLAISARTVHRGDPTGDHSMSIHRPVSRPLPGSLEETAELIRERGRETLPVPMDLTDLTTVEQACTTILDEWGGVDVVVNNGRHIGPGLMDTILDTPIGEYRKFLEAHGVAPIRITQMLLPAMLAKGAGTFVTISSSAGYDWYPRNPPGQAGVGLGYRIGKAAGHALVGSILPEYSGRGIRAFNVNPGFIITERNAPDVAAAGYDPSAGAPPSAVGATVVWLVTDPAADALMWGNIEAQELALERGLCPDWRRKG
jgi:NAD(P)-dependent dehydrogenase (short-subunit alcohol dehydrogenase family)